MRRDCCFGFSFIMFCREISTPDSASFRLTLLFLLLGYFLITFSGVIKSLLISPCSPGHSRSSR